MHDDYIVRADDCSFFLCLDHKLSRLRDTKHNRLYDSVFHPGIDILYLVPSNRDLNPCVDRQGDYYKEHNNDVVRANDGSFYLCLNHKLSRLCDKKHDRLYDSVFYPGVNILYLISSDRDLNPGVDRSGDYYKEHNADGLRVDNLDLYLHRLDQLSCLRDQQHDHLHNCLLNTDIHHSHFDTLSSHGNFHSNCQYYSDILCVDHSVLDDSCIHQLPCFGHQQQHHL